MHKPRKRFGQNFLHNQPIIDAIIRAINPQPDDNVLEIGPGLGALTEPLLRKLNRLIAIEIDTDLQTHLKSLPNAPTKLHLIEADALFYDYSQWGQTLRVVGNLPYNISTPLILHLLQHIKCIKDMHFMLQKEVVDRLVAQPGCKAYGRLSVMLQYFCIVTHLFDVPPSAFNPQPKVDSAIVRLVPHNSHLYPPVDLKFFEKLIAHSFAMRRKTIANNLKPLISAMELESIGIAPSLRPEQISVAQYVQLCCHLMPMGRVIS